MLKRHHPPVYYDVRTAVRLTVRSLITLAKAVPVAAFMLAAMIGGQLIGASPS